MIYVRHPKRDTWHWYANCGSFPRSREWIEVPGGERPKSGELCNQCLSKERRGTGVRVEST